jgi:hypothetical protein
MNTVTRWGEQRNSTVPVTRVLIGKDRRSRHIRAVRLGATTIAPGNPPDPVSVFRLRSWARGYLAGIGELTLQDAVDDLQRSAKASGLVESIGQDAVQSLMCEGFEQALHGR